MPEQHIMLHDNSSFQQFCAHLSARLTRPCISCTPRWLALSSMPSDSMAWRRQQQQQ
jgi:hypothetical protein